LDSPERHTRAKCAQPRETSTLRFTIIYTLSRQASSRSNPPMERHHLHGPLWKGLPAGSSQEPQDLTTGRPAAPGPLESAKSQEVPVSRQDSKPRQLAVLTDHQRSQDPPPTHPPLFSYGENRTTAYALPRTRSTSFIALHTTTPHSATSQVPTMTHTTTNFSFR